MAELTDDEIITLINTGKAPERGASLSDDEIVNLINGAKTNAPQEPTSTAQNAHLSQMVDLDTAAPPAGEPAPPLQIKRLREAANSVVTTQRRPDEAWGDYVNIMKEHGLNTEFALDDRYGNKIRAEADVAALQFMRDTMVGDLRLIDVQGKDMEVHKQMVRQSFAIASLAKHAPIVGGEARAVYGGMVRRVVGEQMERVLDQASGERDPALAGETQRLAGLAQLVNQASDDALFKSMTTAFMLDPADPKSPTEELRQTVPSDVAPFFEAPFLRWIGEGVNKIGVESAAAQLGDVNSDGEVPSPKRQKDVTAAIVSILGPTWSKQLRAQQTNTRARHNLAKLGVDFSGGVPTYSDNATDFIPVLMGGSFQAIVDAGMAAISAPQNKLARQDIMDARLASDDALKEKLDEVRGRLGSVGEAEFRSALIEDSVAKMIAGRARGEAIGTEHVDPNHTPVERAAMGQLNSGLLEIMERGERLFQGVTNNVKKQDQETTKAWNDITGTALDKNFAYALTNSESLAASTDGFFDAFATSAALNRDGRGFFGGLRTWANVGIALLKGSPNRNVESDPQLRALLAQRAATGMFTQANGTVVMGDDDGGDSLFANAETPQDFDFGNARINVLQDHQMFKGSTPESLAALLRNDNSVEAIYARDLVEATKDRDKLTSEVARFNRALSNGDALPFGYVEYGLKVGRLGVHTFADSIRHLSVVVNERPEEAISATLVNVPFGLAGLSARRALGQFADLTGGAIANTASKAILGHTTGHRRLSNIVNAAKVSQGVDRIMHANPNLARRLEQGLQDLHASRIAAGDIDGASDAVAAAAAAAKLAADEVEATGALAFKTGRHLGKAVADSWDTIAAEPGAMSNIIEAVDAHVRKGGFKGLANLTRMVMGNKRARATMRDLVDVPEVFDEVKLAFDKLTKGGAELEQTAASLSSKAKSLGVTVGDLDADTVRGLLPQEFDDVITLVDVAQQSPLTKPGFSDGLSMMLRRLRGATEPELLPQLKATVEDYSTLIATRIIDRTGVRQGWQQSRSRTSRVLQHIQERRRQERQTAREAARRDFEALQGGDPAVLEATIKKHEKFIQLTNDRLGAIDDMFKRLKTHDADLAFDPRELGPLVELGSDGLPIISDADIEMLMTTSASAWGVPLSDVLHYRVRGKLTAKANTALATKITNTEKLIGAQRAKLKGLALDDPDLVAKQDAVAGRLVQLHERLGVQRKLAVSGRDGRTELIGVDRNRFMDLLTHEGLDEGAKLRKTSLLDARQAVATSRNAGLGSNPFLPNAVPIRMQQKMAAGGIKNLGAYMHGHMERNNILVQERAKMTAGEAVLLDNAVRGLRGEGGPSMAQVKGQLKEMLEKYPDLEKYFDDPASVGLVRDFAVAADRNLGELFALMDSLGVQESVIRKFKEKGYDPQLYGLYERAGLVKGSARDKLFVSPEQAAKHVAEPLLGATGRSLKFQRLIDDFRLVIDEPTNRVELQFPTRAQANQFLARRYGKRVKFKAGNEAGVEFWENTDIGDTVRLGAPLKNIINILDPIGSRSERLAEGMSRAFRDLGAQQVLEAVNLFGNMVIDEQTRSQWQRRFGNRINKAYQAIPNNREVFGSIAGKFVHRKVLADINRAANAFDGLDQVLKGMREVMHRTGGADAFPEQLVREGIGGFGGFVDAVTGTMKQNLILLNSRVWLGNMVFNVVLDAMAGTDVFGSAEGLSVLWKEIKGRKALQAADLGIPRSAAVRQSAVASLLDPIEKEMIEGGLDVGFFEGFVGPDARSRALQQMMGMDDLGHLDALSNNRRALLAKMEAGGLKTPENKKLYQDLNRDLSAIDIAIEEKRKGWFRKLGRNMTAVLGNQGVLEKFANDAFGNRGGVAQNRTWELLRQLYNDIDTTYKRAAYRHKRENKGYGAGEALQHVRDFAQNYRDIPTWLKPTGGKGAFLSLITSFPYEAFRISKNLMLQKPGGFVAMMGMMPAMNMAMMTQAGIDYNEFMALAETRGLRTQTDSILSVFDTLYIPGPGNTIASSIDVGLINPFPNLVGNDFSPLARWGANLNNVDEEVDMLTQIPLRVAGNFLFNNPIFGGAVSLTAGVDVGTGRPLWDDRMSGLQKVGAYFKSLASNYVPPWVGGSRMQQEYDGAREAVINPRTGRPLDAKQKGEVVSAAGGFRVKGRAASTAAQLLHGFTPGFIFADDFDDPAPIDWARPENVLVNILRKVSTEDPAGNNRSQAFPVHSLDSELRKWALKKMQSDDPAEAAAAQKAMDKIIDENYERFWKPLGAVRTLSDRERMRMFQFIDDYTVEAQMNRLPVLSSTAALLEMDRTGLFSDRRLGDMIQQARFSPLGEPKISGDPGHVQQAVEAIGHYITVERPNANPRLGQFKRWLEHTILPESKVRYQREIIRKDINKRREETAERLRRG